MTLPIGEQVVKSKDVATHVEPTVEDLRTRVRFSPPPPSLNPGKSKESQKPQKYRGSGFFYVLYRLIKFIDILGLVGVTLGVIELPLN